MHIKLKVFISRVQGHKSDTKSGNRASNGRQSKISQIRNFVVLTRWLINFMPSPIGVGNVKNSLLAPNEMCKVLILFTKKTGSRLNTCQHLKTSSHLLMGSCHFRRECPFEIEFAAFYSVNKDLKTI